MPWTVNGGGRPFVPSTGVLTGLPAGSFRTRLWARKERLTLGHAPPVRTHRLGALQERERCLARRAQLAPEGFRLARHERREIGRLARQRAHQRRKRLLELRAIGGI